MEITNKEEIITIKENELNALRGILKQKDSEISEALKLAEKVFIQQIILR